MAVQETFSTSLPLAQIASRAATIDREGRFPRESVDGLARAGALGLAVPPRWGGPGADPVEQVAAACASSGMVLVMHLTAVRTLAAGITEDEPEGPKHAALEAAARGEQLLTLAYSERALGWCRAPWGA